MKDTEVFVFHAEYPGKRVHMRNTRKWNKMAAAVVSALILAVVGCGNTQTGAASQEDVENAAQEASLIEEAIEEEESAAAEDTSFENAEETAVEIPPADISNVKIDYKTSEIYSKEDMDKAIEKIYEEFGGWDGCVMYDISYTDDATSTDNLSYIRSLDTEKDYTQCIVFVSNFHSPVVEYGAWEPDYDYNDYQWYLGRTEGGDWELLTWGY